MYTNGFPVSDLFRENSRYTLQSGTGDLSLRQLMNESLVYISCGQQDTDSSDFQIVTSPTSLLGEETLWVFPLYSYPETGSRQGEQQTGIRSPNLDTDIVGRITAALGLAFVPEKEDEGRVCFVGSPELRTDFRLSFAPADILDYIHGVLKRHSNGDSCVDLHEDGFPVIPYPENADTFWRLVILGNELRRHGGGTVK
ncbi:hypothetical protein GCM10023188_47370 [Pontibacter saemangeumensis]|uniref:Type ISP restriction-modification enzyme LLaBIII C-terminal specificity domain-containing protein n=1 Tax=Pontibacter saemangeumensis TaxID=1084525 RepID=A0ABP8M8M1_9BACT